MSNTLQQSEPMNTIVVADSSGFVGAFTSESKARDFVEPYASKGMTFVLYRYPLDDARSTTVFVLPYRVSDAVAFVSDNADRCRLAQTALGAVGLVYEDDVTYWEQKLDVPCAPAIARLNNFLEGVRLYGNSEETQTANEDVERKEKALFADDSNGPLDRLIRESEKLNILEGVCTITDIASRALPAIQHDAE
jgi:hypothetical protein